MREMITTRYEQLLKTARGYAEEHERNEGAPTSTFGIMVGHFYDFLPEITALQDENKKISAWLVDVQADRDQLKAEVERLTRALSEQTDRDIAGIFPGAAKLREGAEPVAWREITEDDQPPLDTDVIVGHWLAVSTRPTEWLVEVGHYGSKRGGWIHGGATHWLPLDVLPAAPALAQEGK